MRPTSSPFLARNETNTRGVRKVNTKFMPRIFYHRIYSRVIAIRGSTTVRFKHVVNAYRKILINVSSNTTLYTTTGLTVHGRGENGEVMTLLPSANSECLSARLCGRMWTYLGAGCVRLGAVDSHFTSEHFVQHLTEIQDDSSVPGELAPQIKHAWHLAD